MHIFLAFPPAPFGLVSDQHVAKRWVMKVCISEFPDDSMRQAAAWDALTAAVAILHVAAQQFGSATGLGLALVISICWNLGL
jgi:hypothetical protein